MRVDPLRPGEAWEFMTPGDAQGEVIGVPIGLLGHVDDGSLPWDVHFTIGSDQSGRVAFSRVELVQRGVAGPAITPSMIRGVPLGALLDEAIRLGGNRYLAEPPNAPLGEITAVTPVPESPPTKHERERFTKARPAQPPRRNAVTQETVAEATRLYNREKALGTKNPMQAVADEMGVARSTIANYLKRAKKRS